MTATSDAFKEIVPPLLHPPCSRSNIRRCLRWRGILITFNEEMCGRHRTTSEEELARLYHISIPSQTDLPISYNIAPSQKVLTIRFNPETRVRSLHAIQWAPTRPTQRGTCVCLISKEIIRVKQLFEVLHDNLLRRNAAYGGEEILRLRAYDKFQKLVFSGAVKKSGKIYTGNSAALATMAANAPHADPLKSDA
jgi:hypothetical protein